MSFENVTGDAEKEIRRFFDENGTYISDWVQTKITFIWSIIQPFVNFFVDVWNDITTAIREFTENPALKNFLSAINDLLVAAQPYWQKFNDLVRLLSSWIGTQLNVVLGALRGILNGIWQFVKNYIIGVIENVTSKMKMLTAMLKGDWKKAWEEGKQSAINALKGIVNNFLSFLNIFSRAINGVIESLNRLSFDLPDWVPKFGGQKWGFNIGWRMPEYQMLASGAVIQQPTLAMMGEYAGARSNPEIVSPQSTMRETFLESIVPLLNTLEEGFDRVIEAIRAIDPSLNIDGVELARILAPYLDKERVRRGTTIFQV